MKPVLGYLLKQVPKHVLRHMPDMHLLEHVPRHVSRHVLKQARAHTVLMT